MFVRENGRILKHGGGGRFGPSSNYSGGGGGRGSTRTGVISHGAAVMAIAETKVSLKEGHEWRNVGDGMSKNCVVYTCGYCGTKRKLKGGLSSTGSKRNT